MSTFGFGSYREMLYKKILEFLRFHKEIFDHHEEEGGRTGNKTSD